MNEDEVKQAVNLYKIRFEFFVNSLMINKEYPFFLILQFEWHKEYGYYGKDNEVKDISIAKKLHPNIKTYEQYVLNESK